MQLKCIKCKNLYEEKDVEAYYCPECLKEKKAIAAEIDAKIALRPHKEVKSGLQVYDEAKKVRGFPSARDLGI